MVKIIKKILNFLHNYQMIRILYQSSFVLIFFYIMVDKYFKFSIFSLGLYYLYKNKQRSKVILEYQETQKNIEIVQKCPSLHSYQPCLYLNGFLHTIISVILPCDKTIKSINEKIEDTGISIDWILRDESDKNLFMILPGLTGNVQESYINTIVVEAMKKNFKNICVYNYRMLSKDANYFFQPEHLNYGLNLKPNQFRQNFLDETFPGLDSDFHFLNKDCVEGNRLRVDLCADLHHTLEYLQRNYKYDNVLALGCSYGANQLCTYLGRFQEKALINAGVSICCPYQMILCNKYLTFTWDFILAQLLKRKVRSFMHIFEEKRLPDNWNDMDLNQALKSFKIKDFDQHYSSKIYGYKSVDAYYRHFSAINWIHNIKVPLLCISSFDDAICHEKAGCREEILQNPRTIQCSTGLGGHLGFVEGIIPKSTWFPKPSIEFLVQFLNQTQ